MDDDKTLTSFEVTYALEPGSPSLLKRIDTRESTVGIIKYDEAADKWLARSLGDPTCDEPDCCDGEEHDTLDQARSYLIQRHEAATGWSGA